MKIFFRNFFTPEQLGRWALFSLLLAALGSWSVAAWMTLAGRLLDFSNGVTISPFFTGTFILFVLIAAFFNLAFFYSCVPEKFKKWFPVFCGILLAAVPVAGYFWGKEIAFYTFVSGFFWVLPLVVFHKNSCWVIPGSACWTLFFMGCGAFYDLMQQYYRILNWDFTMFSSVSAITALWSPAVLCGGFFCTAKLYSAESNHKKIFSLSSAGVLAVWAICWLIMVGMALYEEKSYEQHLLQTERFFGFPLTNETARNFYLKQRRSSPDFWNEFESRLKRFTEELKKKNCSVFLKIPRINIDQNNFTAWKNTFEASPEVKHFEKLISGVIPPSERDWTRYNLIHTSFDDSFSLHIFGRLQAWRIRFSIANNDVTEALNALDRINKCIDHLRKDYLCLQHLFIKSLLINKNAAIEMLIESGKLSEQELKKQITQLTEERKILMQLEPIGIAGELIDRLDSYEGVWHGKLKFITAEVPAMKHFRWFYPQLWYIFRRSINFTLQEMKKSSMKEISVSSLRALPQYFLRKSHWNYDMTSARYTELATKNLVLETLLKLELEKRKKGFYPDTTPDWFPSDPFSGKKLRYSKGKIALTECIYDPRTASCVKTVRNKNAICISSAGIPAAGESGIIRAVKTID